MVYAWIIPISIVAILGISGYLVYRYVIFDILANSSINNTLKRYNIKKTQYEIIKEFNEMKGEKLSDGEIRRLAKHYRRNEPDQFLSMYDNLRDRPKNQGLLLSVGISINGVAPSPPVTSGSIPSHF